MLVIFCVELHLSLGEKLKCNFENRNYSNDIDILYTCYVSSLDNSYNNLTIDGLIGEHNASKNNKDVNAIYIENTNTKYIPENLGYLNNLISLTVDTSQLVEIKNENFRGMQDLEYLSLWNNKLKSVPLDIFTTVTKLRYINLNYNEIEEIPNQLFTNNLKLEKIYLSNNKIKFIGTTLFDGLTNLKAISLNNNICVKDVFLESTAIIQLKKYINLNCKSPIENPVMITTLTTSQSLMKLLRKELMEKIINLEMKLLNTKKVLQNEQNSFDNEMIDCHNSTIELLIIKNERNNLLKANVELEKKQNACKAKDVELKNEFIKSKEEQKKKAIEIIKLRDDQLMNKLKCEFKDQEIINWITGYYCYVSSLDSSDSIVNIDGYSGVHLSNKNINDVNGLMIHNVTMNFIPANLGLLFNLTSLSISFTQLIEIHSKDFHEMHHLVRLSLSYNKLQTLPFDVFFKLPKLKIINLIDNQLEEIPNELFKYILNLEKIYLEKNNIKFIGLQLFNALKNLHYVDLENNTCLNKFYNGPTAIIQLKNDIKSNCKNPNDPSEIIFDLLEENKKLKAKITKLERENCDESKFIN